MLYVKYGRTRRSWRLKMLTTTDDGRTTDGRRMPGYTISSSMSLRLRWAKMYTHINVWKRIKVYAFFRIIAYFVTSLLLPGCCTVRNYSQICNNCKVSTTCADNFRTQTLDIESCSDECLAMEVDQCNMGVVSGYAHTGYTCKLYQVCTEVEFGMPSTSIRRTCSEGTNWIIII